MGERIRKSVPMPAPRLSAAGELMVYQDETIAELRAELERVTAERDEARRERDAYIQLSEDMKMALRQPGTKGSYVEWAKQCRSAVDLLDAERREHAKTAALTAESMQLMKLDSSCLFLRITERWESPEHAAGREAAERKRL